MQKIDVMDVYDMTDIEQYKTRVRFVYDRGYMLPVECPDGWRFFDGDRLLENRSTSSDECWRETAILLHRKHDEYADIWGRSRNYADMSAEEQWEDDKKNGLLDWDGKVLL